MNNIDNDQPPILLETPDWVIAADGMESKETGQEDGGYWIAKERLAEPGWIAELGSNGSERGLAFIETFYDARRLLGVGDTDRSVEVALPKRPDIVVRLDPESARAFSG